MEKFNATSESVRIRPSRAGSRLIPFVFFAFLLSFCSFREIPVWAGSECIYRRLRSVLLDTSKTPNLQDAHGAITHDLFTGKIVSFAPFSKDGNNHGLYQAKLEGTDPFTGRTRAREAFFKPRVYGDEDGWSRTPMEFVAYFLNRKLGMDYVPPIAYRKWLSISADGRQFTEGAFIFKAPGFQSLHSMPSARYPEFHESIVSDNRILNVLLQNQDGHSKNLGMAAHWVDGNRRPAFIDFGASLRKGTHVTMTHYPAYENSEPVTRIRRETYNNLKELRHDMFSGLIRDGLISSGEVWSLLGRRDGIIRYFDDLIHKEGTDQVFLP